MMWLSGPLKIDPEIYFWFSYSLHGYQECGRYLSSTNSPNYAVFQRPLPQFHQLIDLTGANGGTEGGVSWSEATWNFAFCFPEIHHSSNFTALRRRGLIVGLLASNTRGVPLCRDNWMLWAENFRFRNRKNKPDCILDSQCNFFCISQFR